ncbi:hypothetical protein [Methylocaldum sp.]|uniref:hypothetical protein n=1 Tax=Methylocaldum sp. TaxID=1969727 RepID=UPI002D53A3E9|nr:hypothetical protein [Methylocaldum sp.]HYE37505.1 hypothetical protein [Methylocaldum sp.]
MDLGAGCTEVSLSAVGKKSERGAKKSRHLHKAQAGVPNEHLAGGAAIDLAAELSSR